jgi:hypothetical protein
MLEPSSRWGSISSAAVRGGQQPRPRSRRDKVGRAFDVPGLWCPRAGHSPPVTSGGMCKVLFVHQCTIPNLLMWVAIRVMGTTMLTDLATSDYVGN